MSARPARLWQAGGGFIVLTALLAGVPAHSQDADGLRGTIAGAAAEQQARRGALDRAPTGSTRGEEEAAPDPASAKPYEPASPGAIVEPQQSALQPGAFVDPGDPFRDEPLADSPPLPAPRPGSPSSAPQPGGKLQPALRAEIDSRRAEAISGGEFRREEDPFAPLGLRTGSFVVRPSLEQGFAWTSNASGSPSGSSAVLSETTLRLDAVSDWSRHSAALSAYGTFRESLSGEEVSDPEAGIDADLILDFADGFRGTASLGYSLDRESATAPVDLPPTISRPLRQNLTGGLGLEKDAGKFRLGLRGELEREQFGEAELEGGGTLSQRDRDFVFTRAVLRTGYEISPALTPFLEAELGRKTYDLRLDGDGYERSATRTGLRAGLALDLGEKFGGELSAGWLREDIDDARLAALSALSLDADLFWSPVRGTILGLQTTTAIEGATEPGESGSVLYAGRLTAERRLRSDLTGTASLGAEWRDYAGSGSHDLMLSAEAGLTYWLNRFAGLTGRVRHETVSSGDPARESETSSVFLGVKLQR